MMRIMFIGFPISLMILSGNPMIAIKSPPPDIEIVFDNFVKDFIRLSPETGTELGLDGYHGLRVPQDRLDDVSVAGIDSVYAFYKSYKALLEQYESDRSTPALRFSRDILIKGLDYELQGEKFRYHTYLINPGFSFHSKLTTLMTEHHKIRNVKDGRDYIARLRLYPAKVDQVLEQLKIREKKKLIPPIFIIEDLQWVIDEFLKTPDTACVLYGSFKSRVADLTGIDGKTKAALCAEVLQVLDDIVYPAYRRVADYLTALKPKADDRAGVWKLADGDEYYKYCLRYYTTTDMTPEAVHQLGLKEVKRIQDEIVGLFKTLGVKGNNYAEMLAIYKTMTTDSAAPELYYPDNEAGKLQTLAGYQSLIDSMTNRLPEMFSVLPKARVKAERVPLFKEATAGTYYQPAKLDGSAPGIFYANLGYRHFKPAMPCLTYHEAIPGHHLQIALEQESPDTRLFKSFLFFTGFGEGWALYAERLAKEQGFYRDTRTRIGYLKSELFRAIRLVLDTGLHYKRWPRDQALQYMRDNYGSGWYGEIDRYVTWPGQACAYKIGELKIVELREKARQALGNKFDLKDFHTEILKRGSMPLAMLEQIVDEYIKTKSQDRPITPDLKKD
jgi:uncharacterized protein (DUF885 family)